VSERIEQIKEREAKASGESWRVAESKDGYFIAYGSTPISPEKYLSKEDADFMAHSREDIPFLLKEFALKEAECAELRAIINKHDIGDDGEWPSYAELALTYTETANKLTKAEAEMNHLDMIISDYGVAEYIKKLETELAELKESSQRAIKRLQDECDSCNIRTGLEKENAELRERVKELEAKNTDLIDSVAAWIKAERHARECAADKEAQLKHDIADLTRQLETARKALENVREATEAPRPGRCDDMYDDGWDDAMESINAALAGKEK
jgi:chromosome segregation ATPase